MPFVEDEAARLRAELWPDYLADTRRKFPGWWNYFFARNFARQRLDAAMDHWWKHDAPFWRELGEMKERIDAIR